MLTVALSIAALAVACANGANDNAKGVATLIGSRVTTFRRAIRWANLATFLGAVAAIPTALFVNSTLIRMFSGAGLLPNHVTLDGRQLLAVALGAAMTVLIATRMGLPISTTHSLVGALVGAGVIAVGPDRLLWSALVTNIVVPLVFSPAVAALATLLLYPLLRSLRGAGAQSQLCLCIEQTYVPVMERNGTMVLASSGRALSFDERARCETRAAAPIRTFSTDRVVTAGQYVTSGLVSFARGLNDAPKIAAILVTAAMLGFSPPASVAISAAVGSVALAMLVGGAFFTRRVAKTMSQEIAAMDHAHGFLASSITAALVLAASFGGLPVSTTHVAVGSLFGIGVANGSARLTTLTGIVTAWILTVPIAALVASIAYLALKL